jgi:ubiquinone/menaquinone biosynthesis C-methylase UbiE
MSCCVPEQNWHLGNYEYPFYRYTVEKTVFSDNPEYLLDAGCGPNGSSLSRFNSKNFVGVDISKTNVNSSKKRYPKKEYVLASLDALPFKKEAFDKIVCIDVIEHVKEKETVFKELSRVSKANGCLVGSTSNELNPLLLFDSVFPFLSEPLQRKFAPGHYERHKRVHPKLLTDFLRKAGFKGEYYLFGFPVFNPWIYQYSALKIPLYGHLWVCLDRLLDRKILLFLKETLVWRANKQSD